ncbi:DoxX family protein [Novosphingobium tardum]|uniref:DoxX family protein n=1 Tax=Novosphingobium tardum TaxID=1538021 RepID=A0ABV8RSC4_9SPHN
MARGRIRIGLRWLLAVFYLVAGYFHLARPGPFLTITPHWVPFAPTVIFLTGLAELAGAAALVQPWSAGLRRAGGIGLALYAVCVFPANINHLMIDMGSPHPTLGWAYHVPRMFAQPLLVWLALWSAQVIEWPFAAPRQEASA